MKTNILEVKNLYLEVVNKDLNVKGEFVRLINGVSFKAYSGRLTVIMGASGSGKTSLFNTIVGNIDNESKSYGRITYNGEERTKEDWFKRISYLEQDAYFLPTQTVKDFITYTATFREPNLSSKEINFLVNDSLKSACIIDKSGALIETLSGGELKRVMVANALVTNPDIVFLDEPTTGLDSHNALLLVNYLKEVAISKNKIVIMTVHQPTAGLFDLFDELLFLGSGGNVFYSGAIKDLKNFLIRHEFVIPEILSLSEFMFELHSRDPYPLSIASFQPKVAEIIENNIRKEKEEVTDLVLKDQTSKYFTNGLVNFNHVYALIKRNVEIRLSNHLVKIWIVFLILVLMLNIYLIPYYTTISFSLNVSYRKLLVSIGKEKMKSFDRNESFVVQAVNSIILKISGHFLPLSRIFNDEHAVIYKELYYGYYSVYSFYLAVIGYEMLKILFCILLNLIMLRFGSFKNFGTLASYADFFYYLFLVSYTAVFIKYLFKSNKLAIRFSYIFSLLILYKKTTFKAFNNRLELLCMKSKSIEALVTIIYSVVLLLVPNTSYDAIRESFAYDEIHNLLGRLDSINNSILGKGFKFFMYNLSDKRIYPYASSYFNTLYNLKWMPFSRIGMIYYHISALSIIFFLTIYNIFRKFNLTVRLKLI